MLRNVNWCNSTAPIENGKPWLSRAWVCFKCRRRSFSFTFESVFGFLYVIYSGECRRRKNRSLAKKSVVLVHAQAPSAECCKGPQMILNNVQDWKQLRKLWNLLYFARPSTKSTIFIHWVARKASPKLRKLQNLRNLRKLRNLLYLARPSTISTIFIHWVVRKASPKLRKLQNLRNLLYLARPSTKSTIFIHWVTRKASPKLRKLRNLRKLRDLRVTWKGKKRKKKGKGYMEVPNEIYENFINFTKFLKTGKFTIICQLIHGTSKFIKRVSGKSLTKFAKTTNFTKFTKTAIFTRFR